MRHSTTEASLPSRRRRFTLPLPTDPSEEELIRAWTLADSDLDEVRRCRRAGNRLRFALQLCILRRYGRFVSASKSRGLRGQGSFLHLKIWIPATESGG